MFPGDICIGNAVWNPECFSQSVYPSTYKKVAITLVSSEGGIWYFAIQHFKQLFPYLFIFFFPIFFQQFPLNLFFFSQTFLSYTFSHCILLQKLHLFLCISICFLYLRHYNVLLPKLVVLSI